MTIQRGDQVEFEYVGRLDNGTVFDTSQAAIAEESELADAQPGREYAPLSVEVGNGRVIEGLEEALVGMAVGDDATVRIEPEKAYGERTEENVRSFERAAFDEILQGENPTVGMHVQTQQGVYGEIIHVDDENVRVDFNHELAGETLEFEIEILSIE